MTTQGLIIDTPHIDHILSGRKSWEMRSTRTKTRGPVALIKKGSGAIFGIAYLVDSLGPLDTEQMLANQEKHLITPARVMSGEVSKWCHAWVFERPEMLPTPIPYRHPNGAVIWVNLEGTDFKR